MRLNFSALLLTLTFHLFSQPAFMAENNQVIAQDDNCIFATTIPPDSYYYFTILGAKEFRNITGSNQISDMNIWQLEA